MSKPLIFDLRGFSLDDGPGIRTTVFLKGCPLSCIWCHNPESWSPELQIAFYPELCIGCKECIAVCPEGATDMTLRERINRERCKGCCDCAGVCPSTALKAVGKYYPPDELVNYLLKNRSFYQTSGGGVTFSGGEPTLHMDYLREVTAMLKDIGVHIAIQTTGFFDIEEFRVKVLPYTDLIFFDLKLIDSVKHRTYTGIDNHIILSNFIALALEVHDRLVPRTPLVPGITATGSNLKEIGVFLRDLGYEKSTLLPYNPAGSLKRRRLGMFFNTVQKGQMKDEKSRYCSFKSRSVEEFD